jgi:hypothetical protein
MPLRTQVNISENIEIQNGVGHEIEKDQRWHEKGKKEKGSFRGPLAQFISFSNVSILIISWWDIQIPPLFLPPWSYIKIIITVKWITLYIHMLYGSIHSSHFQNSFRLSFAFSSSWILSSCLVLPFHPSVALALQLVCVSSFLSFFLPICEVANTFCSRGSFNSSEDVEHNNIYIVRRIKSYWLFPSTYSLK